MIDKNTYYVMVVPTSKAKIKFRPCVLEYGLTFDKATAVMRNFIMSHGLWFKVGGRSSLREFRFTALPRPYPKITSLHILFWGLKHDKGYTDSEDRCFL